MVKNPNKIKGKSANAILETMESVAGYPDKLKFFKVYCSKFYWARVYINGAYKVRSLKTESRKEAINLTKKFYEDALVNDRTGLSKAPKSRSFTNIGNTYIETLNGIGKDRLYRDDLNRFKKELIPHFGEKDIGLISNADIGDLIKKLQRKELAPTTINHYIIVLRKILNYAADNQLIKQVPNFPKIKGKSTSVTRRDYFDENEYKSLSKAVEELAKDGVKVRGIPITLEMKFLIQFMVNAFIRPSDLRVLQHHHVELRINKEETNPRYQRFLLLSHPATKTTDQEVVTMPMAVPVYEKLLAFQTARNLGHSSDYLFLPSYQNRNTMMAIVGRLFKVIVEKAGVKGNNEKHTLYSLRHSAIMFRLQFGNTNTLQLAKNARTSQAMIEKFYASRLTNLMGVTELTSFKHRATGRKPKQPVSKATKEE